MNDHRRIPFRMPQDVRDWSWSMATKVEELDTQRTIVETHSKSGKQFKAPRVSDGAIIEQWWSLSSNEKVALPDVGADIIISYDISPPSEGYEERGPTFWARKIVLASNGDVPAAHEATAQRVDQANEQHDGISAASMSDAASEIAEPKKPPQTSSFENPMNASIEWQVCVKEAAATLRANLEWCVAGQHDANVRLPITGTQIAFVARQIFYGKKYPQHEEAHEGAMVEIDEQGNVVPVAPPNQEPGEPERQFTG